MELLTNDHLGINQKCSSEVVVFGEGFVNTDAVLLYLVHIMSVQGLIFFYGNKDFFLYHNLLDSQEILPLPSALCSHAANMYQKPKSSIQRPTQLFFNRSDKPYHCRPGICNDHKPYCRQRPYITRCFSSSLRLP